MRRWVGGYGGVDVYHVEGRIVVEGDTNELLVNDLGQIIQIIQELVGRNARELRSVLLTYLDNDYYYIAVYKETPCVLVTNRDGKIKRVLVYSDVYRKLFEDIIHRYRSD